VRSGLEKIRAAAPVFRELGSEIRRTTLHANQVVMRHLGKVEAFFREEDWRAAMQTRRGQAAALLLGCVVIYGLAAGKNSQPNEFASAQFAAPAAFALQPANPTDGFAGPAGGVATDHVDLRQGAGVAGVPTADDASDENASGAIRSVPSKSKVNAPAGARKPRATSAGSSKPSVAAPVLPAAPIVRADTQRIVGPQAELEAPVVQAAAENSTPKLIAGVEGQKPAQTVLYLEVGAFKDSNWAQSAVEKLSALGYHAISVHQSRLWIQSFHVQVGPYADMSEVEFAQKSLATQGFKTHLVK